FFDVTDNMFFADRETMGKMMTLPDLVDAYLLREDTPWDHEHLVAHHIQQMGLSKVKEPTWVYSEADGSKAGLDKRPSTLGRLEKIVATILARNEEDIIGECIAHTLSRGVDEIILMNNASTDRTREIA